MKSKRYIKVEFFGYAPADLAIQIHVLLRNFDVNMVGGDMKPYTECSGEYKHITKKTKNNEQEIRLDERKKTLQAVLELKTYSYPEIDKKHGIIPPSDIEKWLETPEKSVKEI